MSKRKRTKHINLSEPLVSILVPIFNRFNFLVLTLQSLKNQSYNNIQVICVNDGGESAEKYIEDLNDPRFEYYEHEINGGLPKARNTALKHARGSFISLLDSDDIYMKYAIEFRMYMMKKLNADIVYTRALKDIWEKLENNSYRSIGKNLYWDSPFDRDLILIQNISPCCCPLFSRKSWDNSQNYMFDEELTTTEDHDLWIALSRKTRFEELKIIDCECSYRREVGGQMTGNLNFAPNWIKVFKKWRHTAKNLEYVVNAQNGILKRAGINPEDYGL